MKVGYLNKFFLEERLKKNFSQRVFGNKLGISSKTVSAIETGRLTPSFIIVNKFCEVFNYKIILKPQA